MRGHRLARLSPGKPRRAPQAHSSALARSPPSPPAARAIEGEGGKGIACRLHRRGGEQGKAVKTGEHRPPIAAKGKWTFSGG